MLGKADRAQRARDRLPRSTAAGGRYSTTKAPDAAAKDQRTAPGLAPPSVYPMRERSPVPCAQPPPRGDAPSALAFAESCKGGDVSVLMTHRSRAEKGESSDNRSRKIQRDGGATSALA